MGSHPNCEISLVPIRAQSTHTHPSDKVLEGTQRLVMIILEFNNFLNSIACAQKDSQMFRF